MYYTACSKLHSSMKRVATALDDKGKKARSSLAFLGTCKRHKYLCLVLLLEESAATVTHSY
jgi:hypothetical protein